MSRRKSVDAAISARAYTVRRTLREWILSAQHLQALGRSVGFDPDRGVEERLQRAIAAAPLASPAVAAATREAYVLYYRATTRRTPKSIADLQASTPEAKKAANDAALEDLQACVERLTAAIDPALRDV